MNLAIGFGFIIAALVLLLIKRERDFSCFKKANSQLLYENCKKEKELDVSLKRLNEEIKVLINFAGEGLHDRAVKLSDWGKNKDVDWLIYITGILRQSSSYEKFEEHLKRDDRFVQEKQLLKKDIASLDKDAKLGCIAFYLDKKLREYDE